MGAARLVVVEGPDVGCEFSVPVSGGGIGRGEGNAFQLSDLSVSRLHCAIERRDGTLTLVDTGSRNQTLVNGRPAEWRALASGDEITVGKTRLVFLPEEGGVAVTSGAAMVTLEITTSELLRVALGEGRDSRAKRTLAALAGLGRAIKSAGDVEALGQASCEAARQALSTDRTVVLLRGSGQVLRPCASLFEPRHPLGAQVSLARNVLDKVFAEDKAIVVGNASVPQAVAPLSRPDRQPIGLILAERPLGGQWDSVDLLALSCIAQLLAAALGEKSAMASLSRENKRLRSQIGGTDFIGGSKRFGELVSFVEKVAPTGATVLLTGESGSGKEMVARAIHRGSRRCHEQFIAMNCAAVADTLMESSLFGHERAAFTGAEERSVWHFEAADGGTLFLD